MPDIMVKRVYEPSSPEDGFRVLVDRVWPRGMTKQQVKADLWLKDVAPSSGLRKWFSHDPSKWDEFLKRYFAELDDQPDAVTGLLERVNKSPVTLLYSARDPEYNQANALKAYLLDQAKK